MLRKVAWAGQCALTKIRVVFALFILFWAFPSYARDDAAQLSLSSAKALAQSILASLPAQMPQAEKDKWVDILHLPDNPAIQVSSLAQIPALLPLPSATILRLAQQLSQQQPNRTLSLNTASPVIGFAGYDQNRTLASPQPLSQTTRLLITHSILKQLIWQKISGTAQLSDNGGLYQVPVPPSFPLPPAAPLPPGAIVSSLAPSAAALSPLATAAIATGAAAATAGVAASASSSTDAPAGSGGGTGSSGGSNGGSGGDNSSSGGDGNENLNLSVWETAEYQANIGLAAIQASTAYARGYTGSGVTVSVLDSPFDTDHADLSSRFVTGFDAFDNGTTVHCAVNGCSSSHGTHVAGIIGAQKNDTGTHGVAPDVRIKPVKVFEDDLSFVSSQQLIQAINAGSGTAITAMNNSWGTSKVDSVTHNGASYYYKRPYRNYADNSSSEYIWAYQGGTALTGLPPDEITAWQNATQDTIIVFANGNDGLNTATGRVQLYTDANAQNEAIIIDNAASAINANIPSFRGSYPTIDSSLSGEWLTVVALDQNNQIASFSNGCGEAASFCIAAPGVSINAPIDVDDTTNSSDASYGLKNGTSMAAPHVTGALALLKQQFPNLTPTQLTSLVLSTATDLGASGTDNVYGVGMLNLAEASQPQGSVSVAGANGQALTGVNPAQTSIQSSRAFGQAFMRKFISLGLMDSYQRAYSFQPEIAPARQYSVTAQEVMQILAPQAPAEHQFAMNDKMAFSISSTPSQGSQNDTHFEFVARSSELDLSFGNDKTESQLLQRHQNTHNRADILAAKSAFAQIAVAPQQFKFMNPRFRFSQDVQLEFSHLQGSFEAGGDFNEFSSGISWSGAGRYIGTRWGVLTEKDTVLGAALNGFYATATPSVSRYLSVEAQHPIGQHARLSSRFLNMMTAVDMQHADQTSISGLQANSYEVSFERWGDTNEWQQRVVFSLPLATTSGHLQQRTTKGYGALGYHTSIEEFELGNDARQVELDFSHQQQSWGGGNWLVLLHAAHNVNGVAGKKGAGVYLGLTQPF